VKSCVTRHAKGVILAFAFTFFGVIGSAQSIELKLDTTISTVARYRYEADDSLIDLFARWALLAGYDMSYIGSYDLPLVYELKYIKANTLREAVEQTMASYKNYKLNVYLNARIDDKNRHLYLTSASLVSADKMKVAEPKQSPKLPTGFEVNSDDKSMMQVIVRWATQMGYTSIIDDRPVNIAVFPKHPTLYPDYSLINEVKNFKTNDTLKEAINQFLLLYTGKPLTPFKVTVDEERKQLIIIGLVN
jgi:hypothetical protein